MAKSRKRGCLISSIVILVLLGLAALVIWRVVVASQSVATLDRVDSWLSAEEVELASEPAKYGDHPAQKIFVHAQTAPLPTQIFPYSPLFMAAVGETAIRKTTTSWRALSLRKALSWSISATA